MRRVYLGAALLAVGAITAQLVRADAPVASIERGLSMKRVGSDGGAEFYRKTTTFYSDGTAPLVGEEVMAVPDCVRRRSGSLASSCQQLRPEPGADISTATAHDVPVLMRFAADASVGADCEPVACAVYFGENANE